MHVALLHLPCFVSLCFVSLCSQDSIAPIVEALEQGGFECSTDLAGPGTPFDALSSDDLRQMNLNIKGVAIVRAAQGEACSAVVYDWLVARHAL